MPSTLACEDDLREAMLLPNVRAIRVVMDPRRPRLTMAEKVEPTASLFYDLETLKAWAEKECVLLIRFKDAEGPLSAALDSDWVAVVVIPAELGAGPRTTWESAAAAIAEAVPAHRVLGLTVASAGEITLEAVTKTAQEVLALPLPKKLPDGAFDLIVIGGGSGGSAVARRSAGYGAKVCIIERGYKIDDKGVRHGAGIGGTCVNVGCVPKKIMYMAAGHREALTSEISTGKGYGYTVSEGAGNLDWGLLKKNRDAYVARLNTAYTTNWDKAGLTTYLGLAEFVDATTVKVHLNEGGENHQDVLLTAPKIVIACGGEPATPDIPGIEMAINSDGFFDLATQPKKVAVIGAGYIAVEMAGILHGLGSEAHLYFRGDTVMRRGFDPFIVKALMAELQAHGPHLHDNTSPSKLVKEADGTITYTTKCSKTGAEVEHKGYDCVLMAIGRRPVTDTLKLENAGVSVNDKGLVPVDESENTTVPGIYAIGDCTTTGYELTPVAIAAGRRLGDRLFGNEPKARLAYETIATVVFSHPPIGVIGLTEPDARKEFGDENVSVKEASFAAMTYAFNDDDKKVKNGMKLVLKLPEERIVGLHIIGPSSDEMLQGFAIAVRMGATRADFEASVAIHPTIGEEMVTFGGWGQVKNAEGKMVPQLPPHIAKEA